MDLNRGALGLPRHARCRNDHYYSTAPLDRRANQFDVNFPFGWGEYRFKKKE